MLRNLVYLAVFTLFVSMLWVGLSIYHNIKTSTIPSDLGIQIVPINSTFDTSAIALLKKKQSIQVNLADTISLSSASPSATKNLSLPYEKNSSPSGFLQSVQAETPITTPTLTPNPTVTPVLTPTLTPTLTSTPIAPSTGSPTLNNF